MNEFDFYDVAILGGIAAASLAGWVVLSMTRTPGEPWLKYEPRWSVPWGGGIGTVAVVFVAISLLSASPPEPLADSAPVKIEPINIVQAIGNVVLLALVAGLGVSAIRAATGAGPRDFGLPSSGAQLLGDVRLGLVAALLAMLPVYAVQIVFVNLTGVNESHELLETLMVNPTPEFLFIAFLNAVLIAPLLEEFLFRGLFQGWLEKVEDALLGWNTLATKTEARDASDVRLDRGDSDNPFASPASPPTELDTEILEITKLPEVDQESRRSLASFGGLPHGWAPILGSSLLFAIAHFDQGTAPAPLFLFAVIVGYLYQRTHRITPGIVAHMAFNAASLAMVLATSQLGK